MSLTMRMTMRIRKIMIKMRPEDEDEHEDEDGTRTRTRMGRDREGERLSCAGSRWLYWWRPARQEQTGILPSGRTRLVNSQGSCMAVCFGP